MGCGTSMSSTDPNDIWVRWNNYTLNAQAAVNMAKETGFGIDIVYPRFGKIPRQSYAENFKWKGNPKPPEDEEDF